MAERLGFLWELVELGWDRQPDREPLKGRFLPPQSVRFERPIRLGFAIDLGTGRE